MATRKQPISGLRTVKRDFSSNSIPTSSQDSQYSGSDPSAIPWSQSQTAPRKNIEGMSQRLKDIQEALKESTVSSQDALSSSQKARAASGSLNLPAKRKLPPSWNEPDASAPKAKSRTFGTARSANTNSITVPAAETSRSGGKPGKVVLSAEQTHILNLAKEGKSLFYTGSAGEYSALLRPTLQAAASQCPECAYILTSALCRNRKVRTATRDHRGPQAQVSSYTRCGSHNRVNR